MKIIYEYVPEEDGYKLDYKIEDLDNTSQIRPMFKAILMNIIEYHSMLLPESESIIKYTDRSCHETV